MREVSPTALQAMLAQDTPEVFVPWLKIEHADLASPIRVAYDTQTLAKTEGDFLPYPFQINLPSQRDDDLPQITVTIDNTDLTVNEAIRTLVGPPSVTFGVSLASQPDTDEAGPFLFDLQQVTATAETIQGTLGYEDDVFSQQVPGQQYLPTNSPGVFS